ncbi:MAG: hypothetical protein B7Z78_13065 [Rhodospirillales bacterium 20-60-12]|nr:MAG: hypothetical protein B7Z78_13065 [Rhodospirillales bacterium 20-60-12]HQT67962.1 sulfite exporter TauE/SafE family protein [Acetobacteraceae bacterium]
MIIAQNDIIHALSGFAVGLLVGLTGVGGGSLMTPLLIVLFGVHPATAVGTDLLYAGVTKTAGMLTHSIKQTIAWAIVFRLAIGSIPASIITLFVLSHFNLKAPGPAHFISAILGIALILTALTVLVRPIISKFLAQIMPQRSPARVLIITILTGALIGILVCISSVGAGAIGMTILILLYPDIKLEKLVGADIAHAVPLTLIAGAGHWLIGDVNSHLLLTLLIGSIPGITIGSLLITKIPAAALRTILAIILLIVGTRLLT